MQSTWEFVTGSCQLTLRLVMGLVLVGAICRKGDLRARCLGFAVFGWIYLEAAFAPSDFAVPLPTKMLLQAVEPRVFSMLAQTAMQWDGFLDAFFSLWHCLWAVLAAFFGGFLARQLFRAVAGQEEQTSSSPGSAARPQPHRNIGGRLIYFMGFELAVLMVVGSELLSPGLWAGMTFVQTWLLLGLLALRASSCDRRRRVRPLFAAVLGISLLILAFGRSDFDPWPISPTVQLLDDIRPKLPAFMSGYPAGSEPRSAKNARAHRSLERKVKMQFIDETPLEDVLNYVQKQTADSVGNLVPIEIIPIHAGEHTHTYPEAPLRMIDLKEVPLRTSLKLSLAQFDLTYHVENGVLVIESLESEEEIVYSVGRDAYQSVGHCLLALIAAGIGGALAPFVCGLAHRRRSAMNSH